MTKLTGSTEPTETTGRTESTEPTKRTEPKETTELLPNLGGEEGPGWRGLLDRPAVAAEARLWRLLFAPPVRLLYGDPPEPPWPDELGPAPEGPAFPWLGGAGGIVPWIPTEDAVRDRRVAGRALAGPAPGIVRAVHDKAFALAVAREEGLVPPVLRGCTDVLEPAQLRAEDAARAIEARLAAWPAWARARFVLKPRLGSSGRGRVPGQGGRLDAARTGVALERLAERGGAILEPWLERTADLAVQLYVDPVAPETVDPEGVANPAGAAAGPGVTVLGTLESIESPAGIFLGHRGEIDSRGRVFSGHGCEEALREAGALVAAAARARGFFGPCGVDAFTFRDPESPRAPESDAPEAGEPRLRPVVELNARFTTGLVTVGLVRRALPRVKAMLGLAPGERMAFRFWIDLAGDEREEVEARVGEAASGELLLELDVLDALDDRDAPGRARPALLFRRTPVPKAEG